MRKLVYQFVLTVLFISLVTEINGQSKFWIASSDTFKITQRDSLKTILQIRDLLWARLKEGYIYASLDSICESGTDESLYFHFGDQYKWKINRITVDTSEIDLKKVNPNDILKIFTNAGYPFASFTISNIAEKENSIYADIDLKRNVFITYDSMVVTREQNYIKESFLWDLFHINPGKPYKESDFANMTRNIQRVSFLRFGTEPDVGFSNGKAIIYTEIEKVESNSFEGIVGLLQNGNSKSTLTGYIDLELQNLFKSAKRLSFKWNGFQETSQSLQVNYTHPYLLHSDLIFDFGITMLKQDTTFFNRDIEIAFQKFIVSNTLLGFHYQQNLSSIIENSQDQKVIPFKTNWYGISITNQKSRLKAERINGITFKLSSLIGNKKIEDKQASDTLSSSGLAVRVDVSMLGQKIIGRRGLISSSLSFSYFDNENLVRNEFYRIGGLKSFRGFNENEIFAKTLAIEQLEYRQYFESQSYLIGFFDYGFIHDPFSLDQNRFIGSIGGGMALTTPIGLFNFIFASGFVKGQPISINESKIHFGYTSYF